MFRPPLGAPHPPTAAPRGFVFYDLETSGLNRGFDQIVQFAAIRTDGDLLETDRFEMSCRLMPHIVPSPDALAVTSKTFAELRDPARPSHYEMMCSVHRRLVSWGRNVFLGYNTVRFDEEFLRQAFYQTLHPPFLTNTSGNVRTDVLPIVRSIDALRPGLIRIPRDGDSDDRKTFRLEAVAKENMIAHGQAHDAMSDVEATAGLARLVRDRAPDLWAHFVGLSGTAAASAFIAGNDVFVLAGMPGGARTVARIGPNPRMPNVAYCLDMLADTGCLATMSVDQLTAALSSPSSPLVRIKANSAPPVVPLDAVPQALLGGPSTVEIREAADRLRHDAPFVRTFVACALRCEREYPPPSHVEQQLYSGFWSRRDAALAEEFHATEWSSRLELIARIEDPRLRVLARRLVYFECPDLLPATVREATDKAVARRVLGSSTNGAFWLTIPDAMKAIDANRAPDAGKAPTDGYQTQLEEWRTSASALAGDAASMPELRAADQPS